MDPQPLKDVKRALRRRLAAWRKTRGLIQDDVARLVNSTRSTVAGVERGEQVVDRVFWVQCESLLHAGGELIAGYDEYRSFEIRHREEKADAARHARWVYRAKVAFRVVSWGFEDRFRLLGGTR